MAIPSELENEESSRVEPVGSTVSSRLGLPGIDNSTRFCRYCLVLALILLGYDEAAGLFMF